MMNSEPVKDAEKRPTVDPTPSSGGETIRLEDLTVDQVGHLLLDSLKLSKFREAFTENGVDGQVLGFFSFPLSTTNHPPFLFQPPDGIIKTLSFFTSIHHFSYTFLCCLRTWSQGGAVSLNLIEN